MEIEELMAPEEIELLGVNNMTAEQKQCLIDYSFKTYTLGQHVVGDIESIKYDGKVVVLDDGSRWVVDDLDRDTVELWGEFEKVVIIDGAMYKLDDSERVEVEPDYDE